MKTLLLLILALTPTALSLDEPELWGYDPQLYDECMDAPDTDRSDCENITF